jgi:hypothetical protein
MKHNNLLFVKILPVDPLFVNENLSIERPFRKGQPIVIRWLPRFWNFLRYNNLLKMTCYTACLQFLKVVIVTIHN